MTASRPTDRHKLDIDAIAARLRRHERAYHLKIVLALTLGAGMTLVGPLLMTGLAWLTCLMFGVELPFWETCRMVALVGIPLLFLLAWRVQGSVIERFMPDGDTLGGRFLIKRVAKILIVLELANIGPRLILFSFAKIRRRRAVGNVNIPRAAEAVAVLLSSEQGLNPIKLVKPDDPDGTLIWLLAFLMFHDLADVSKSGDRVWLRGDARREMEAR